MSTIFRPITRYSIVLSAILLMLLSMIPQSIASFEDGSLLRVSSHEPDLQVEKFDDRIPEVNPHSGLSYTETVELEFEYIQSSSYQDGETWDRYEIKTGHTLINPGQAAVPYYVHNIVTPDTIVDIKVRFKGLSVVDDVRLVPAPPVYPILPNQDISELDDFIIDEDHYSTNEFFPGKTHEWVRLGGTNTEEGFEWYYSLALYPASYNPVTGTMYLYQGSTATIIYEGPEMEGPAADTTTGTKSRGTLGSEPDEVKYMILTADYLMDEMQELADWKTQKGVPAKVFDVKEIFDNVTLTGRDDPEKLRDYIRWSYKNMGTEYVLMAGDYDRVPPRMLEDPSPYTSIDDGWLPSDLYYVCIDDSTTWDANENNVFGEIGDLDDLIPDLAVGRIAINDALIMSQKIKELIAYEATPPEGTWFERATLVGTNVFDPEDGEKQCEYLRNKYMTNSYDTFTKLYEEDGTVSKDGFKSAVNIGTSLVVYLGHGSSSVWTQNEGYTTLFTYPDTNTLQNGIKKPVITTVSCDTSWFDAPKSNPYGDCIAEGFTENLDKGGIGYLGSVRTTTGIINQQYKPLSGGLQEDFIRQISMDNLHLGQAYVDGLAHYAQSFGHLFTMSGYAEVQACWEEQHLLGEPELTLWVDKPGEFTVTDSTVGDSVTITVKNNAMEYVEDARVTIWLEGEVYEYKTTNSNGKVTFSIATNTDEMASLTVVKDGFIPYISKVKLVDIIPPETSYSITPETPDGLNGWYVNPPSIDFTVNEENSVTYFRWEGAPSAQKFTAPVYAPEGISKIYYYSVDESNNIEEEDYLVIKVDTTTPETGMSMTPEEPDGEAGWYVTVPEITLTEEPLSTVYYHWDSHPFKVYELPFNGLVGMHTLYYYSRDEAGHVEPTNFIKINIDLDTPRTTVKLDPVIADGEHNWYVSKPEVTLSVKETNEFKTYYFWDDETDAVQEYAGPFTADLEGTHKLHYYTADEAGNIEEEKWLDIKIDTITPETTIDVTPSSPTGETNWYKAESPVISLSPSEPEVKIYYYWDSENGRTIYTEPVVAPEGEHFLYFYSVDVAGNRENIRRVNFKVDTEPPGVTCEVLSESGENELGWYLEMPQIQLEMDDEGVIYYYLLKDGEELEDFTQEQLENMKQTYVTIYPVEGIYTYYYFAVDKAGNTGDIDDITLRMDLLDPLADLKADKTVLREDSWVVFDAQSSSDENQVESYRFHIGDDHITDWQDSPELNYTFDEPGVYDVCVEVMDPSGRVSEESEVITIVVKEKPKEMGTELREMVTSTPMILALIVIVVVVIITMLLFVRTRKKRSDYYDEDDYYDDDDDEALDRRYTEFSEGPRRKTFEGRSRRRLGTPPPPSKRLPPPPPPPSVVRIVSNGKTYEGDDDSIDWDDDEEEDSDEVDWDSGNETESVTLECPRCDEYFSVPKSDMEAGNRIRCPHCGAKGNL